MKKLKIISGGQTGVDQIALKVAHKLGIETGGIAPKGYRTETGFNFELRDVYGLIQHESAEYPPRTEMNILNSDCTLLFGKTDSLGSKLAIKLAKKHSKHIFLNPKVSEVHDLIVKGYRVFNIAGNRGSTLSHYDEEMIRKGLTKAFE